jgi:lysyl-tRNA synthetase class 2
MRAAPRTAMLGEVSLAALYPRPLRFASRRLDDVPAIASAAVAIVAVIDLVSAVTRNVMWRGHLLVYVEPVGVMRAAHALAVPVSLALLITAYYLFRRRSRAYRLALVLLSALAAFNIVKGLDVEEALVTAAGAALLWSSRKSFYVRHEPATPRSVVWRLPVLLVGVFVASLAAVAFAAPAGTPSAQILRGTGDLLLWERAPFAFRDELSQMPLALALTSLLALLISAYLVFRPLAAARDLPNPESRRAAADLVREHGADTLSFFKLRGDKQYLFNAEQTAFVGYRIESGVLMVSGDPVGDPDGVESVLRRLLPYAEARGLRIAALGVSPQARALFERVGLRALYVGDEAIVDTHAFTLEGRAIRKVRQSVSRLQKAGYRATTAELGSLDEQTLNRLQQIASDCLRGVPERGFTMAMDSLRNPQGERTLVVLATDEAGTIRAFLHFVPTYGRDADAVSLSFMRRDHDTPNGLTEFLIVEAVEQLRARGVAEVSLNFAAFARFIREPSGFLERTVGRALAVGDAWFQIERLYRFNAKFFPRWEPRYLMYERRVCLPRAAVAALWLEGQLPKPRIRRRQSAAI